jgi:23S rRNA pseudouridine1911/1915/1917 synthase
VPPELRGGRVDVVLAALTGVSRRGARALLGDGCVWLNGRPLRVLSRPLQTSDVLDVVTTAALPRPPARPAAGVPVLLEDRWLVVVDKPAGVASQSPRRRVPGETSALESVSLSLSGREGRRVDLLPVHRLDRPTSGVLALARHREAARRLSRAWAAGSVGKLYLAVVWGEVAKLERTITEPVGRDHLTAGRFRVREDGRPAATRIRALATVGSFSLVEAWPLTGRTHQVRVHLASTGAPVVGDSLYGGVPAVRPLLHAWRLTFPHPEDGRATTVEAPIPADLRAFLAAAGFPPALEGLRA